MTRDETTFMRQWLSRTIAALERRPPSRCRDRALARMRDDLEQYQSNVVPIRVAA